MSSKIKTIEEIKEILEFNPPDIKKDFINHVNYLENYCTNFLFFLEDIRYFPKEVNISAIIFNNFKEKVDFIFQQALNVFLLIKKTGSSLKNFEIPLKSISLNVLIIAKEHLEYFLNTLDTILKYKSFHLDFS